MKKTLSLFSHLISLAVLAAFWVLWPGSVSVSINGAFFVLYGLCLLICPPLGLLRISRFGRGVLAALSVSAFSCGVPAAMTLGGTFFAQAVTLLGTAALGILFISYALPASSAESELLTLRGTSSVRTKKTLFLRSAYAFFFEKSGVFAGLLSVFLLFIAGGASFGTLWSAALHTVLIGLLGYLLYLCLGAPDAAPLYAAPRKSRFVTVCLLTFVLLILVIYVYIGSVYTAPDPALRGALTALQAVLTPALLAVGLGMLCGMLLGFLLSLCGIRFFAAISRGMLGVPAVLTASLLSFLLPSPTLAITVPSIIYACLGMLESRTALRQYRTLPLIGRKKAVTMPLFHFANLSLLPRIGVSALFSSIFIDVVLSDTILSLPEFPRLLAASILALSVAILYILCFLTKEVRHHE